ncbi:MAG: translation initiation factor IF-2 [Flavobacteriaceae bacterium]|jgi:translation initiation factor IF-2|nr:translation initiation factor IF-2 [Flavobacteriaceae bacterium]
MAENIRLNQVIRELNISLERAVEFLASKGIEVEARPTTKISGDVYDVLLDGFKADRKNKKASEEISEEKRKEKEEMREELEKKREHKREEEEAKHEVVKAKADKLEIKSIGKIELEPQKVPVKEEPKVVQEIIQVPEEKIVEPVVEITPKITKQEEPQKSIIEKKPIQTIEPRTKPLVIKKKDLITKEISKEPYKQDFPKKKEVIKIVDQVVEELEEVVVTTHYKKLQGVKSTGKTIDLKQFEKPKKKKSLQPEKKTTKDNIKTIIKNDISEESLIKRKRIKKTLAVDVKTVGKQIPTKPGSRPIRRPILKTEPSEVDVQKQIRETLEKLQGKSGKSKGSKYRRDKRDQHRQQFDKDAEQQVADSKILKITEFVTVSEIASLMNIPVTQIISACMSLGLMVTMNQRLDAETLTIVADEFGFQVNFVTENVDDIVLDTEDNIEDLVTRAPIVTVMGHVDHGKTSLLDYIRKANVITGESGGITQHIGSYSVKLPNGQRIAFLDTPGHEAFTAMRARGAQLTDIVIIVVAADDAIMPQTKEAISHAQAAGVPIVFAINKMDKPTANPEKIKEGLAQMNLLVEDWGGKIQSQDISAKTGLGVTELLEKVLLEAELLDLKANPKKNATGTVVEAQLDKGRGYVSTVLVQSGTLKIGDYILAGKQSGKVKAMYDEKGENVTTAGPSTPVSILGLDGAPQAGDKFYMFDDEREARQIATKRTQLIREQSIRTQKHITLDEIGRRIALGDFKELNIIVKGDVDGSVEALTDSFQKLSTPEIQVNIIHKGVGAITESDVLLASASEAIIIGFNVRPSVNARTLADKEEIDIRNYSIIYNAINDLRDAMEGMLSPEIVEEIVGNVEIREVFKISKVGNIAGCMVTKGKIMRNSKIRIIRDGVVLHSGELLTLKRFKDDAREVAKGFDCGIQIKNYNEIEVGDIIEAYQEVAVKKKLKK